MASSAGYDPTTHFILSAIRARPSESTAVRDERVASQPIQASFEATCVRALQRAGLQLAEASAKGATGLWWKAYSDGEQWLLIGDAPEIAADVVPVLRRQDGMRVASFVILARGVLEGRRVMVHFESAGASAGDGSSWNELKAELPAHAREWQADSVGALSLAHLRDALAQRAVELVGMYFTGGSPLRHERLERWAPAGRRRRARSNRLQEILTNWRAARERSLERKGDETVVRVTLADGSKCQYRVSGPESALLEGVLRARR